MLIIGINLYRYGDKPQNIHTQWDMQDIISNHSHVTNGANDYIYTNYIDLNSRCVKNINSAKRIKCLVCICIHDHKYYKDTIAHIPKLPNRSQTFAIYRTNLL